jgi:uncharacterized membrane protein
MVSLTDLGGYQWMISFQVAFIMGESLGTVSLIVARWLEISKEAAGVTLPPCYAAGDAE